VKPGVWCLFFVFLASTAFAQKLQVDLAQPTTPQNQFQHIQITTTFASVPLQYRLIPPQIAQGALELSAPQWEASPEGYLVRWDAKVLSEHVGAVNLAPFSLVYSQGEKQRSLVSDPLSYQVTPVPGFDQPPQFLPLTPPGFDPLPMVSGLLFWGLLSGAGYGWFRRRQSPQIVTPKTAIEIALSQIEELRPLCDAAQHKALHLKLSTTLKDFIQAQYQIPATGQTTQEFLVYHRNSKALPPAALKALEAYFQSSDQIKFAGFEPAAQFSLNAIEQMKTLVESEIDPV